MATKTHLNKFTAAVIAALAFSGMALAAHAASVFDITYPISKLGGCADRLACKAYCDDSANQSACTAFAEEYGLTIHAASAAKQQEPSDQEGAGGGGDDARLQAINAAIAQDGGPGKCGVGASDPASACREYCDESAHIQKCVQYGESHNILSGEHLDQAKKVAAALASGLKLPAGCTDAQSCEQTCQNPSSLDQAKSCFSFAKSAGILPHDFNEAAAEKVFSAIQNGSAPFSSMRDFEKCRKPTDSSTIKACTDFAVENGLMTEGEAQTLRETGGKGPGGCQGSDACDQYCSEHQDECFQFAKDHNLVTPEQQDRMQHAAAQMQDALQRAPDTVQQCITSSVGQDTLDAITSGARPGSPDIGQKMQACFEQYQGDQQSGNRQGPPPPGMRQEGEGPQFGNDNGVVTPESGSEGRGNRGVPQQPPRERQPNMMRSGNQNQGDRRYGTPPRDGQSGPQTGAYQGMYGRQEQLPPGAPDGQYGSGERSGYPPPPQYPPMQNGMMPYGNGQMPPPSDNNMPGYSPDQQYQSQYQQYPPPDGTTNLQPPPSDTTLPPPPTTNLPPPPPPPSSTSFLGTVSQTAAALFGILLGNK